MEPSSNPREAESPSPNPSGIKVWLDLPLRHILFLALMHAAQEELISNDASFRFPAQDHVEKNSPFSLRCLSNLQLPSAIRKKVANNQHPDSSTQ